MADTSSTISEILRSNVNVTNIHAETTGDIGSHNTFNNLIIHQAQFKGWAKAATYRFTTRSLRQGPQRRRRLNRREEEAESSPEDPVDICLDPEVVTAAAEMENLLKDIPQQSHPFTRKKTENAIKTEHLKSQCCEVLKQSISCADRGSRCAGYHIDDLQCAIKEGDSSLLEWILKDLQQKAADGKEQASQIQTQFPQVKAPASVTVWWEEVIKVLRQIEQEVKKSKEDADPHIQNLMDLGERFRVYSSQLQDLRDRYPLSTQSVDTTKSTWLALRSLIRWKSQKTQ
ncbi:hypothetical protein C8J56DRAFT_923286 [Mycena floridula]|nr:hypothetical protein C8J56DRAFT_923286 [Mycena floridula]